MKIWYQSDESLSTTPPSFFSFFLRYSKSKPPATTRSAISPVIPY